jgi:hypothetical protein
MKKLSSSPHKGIIRPVCWHLVHLECRGKHL